MGVHVTKRIPELPPLTTALPLSLADRLAIWISSEDKTKFVTLSDIYDFVQTGGGTSSAPVIWGGHYIHVVTADENGDDIISIPALAGKDWTVRRGGFPLVPAEFENLDAGGIKLLTSGDTFGEGERLEFFVFSLLAAAPGQAGGGGGSLITGEKVINTNITLDAEDDLGKLIKLRAGATQVTVTLPAVADIAENTIFIVEACITNTVQHKITGTGGQLFYMNNVSKSSIYIAPGENVWIYRGEDGLYIINDFYKNYLGLGRPIASYVAELNELVLKGQLVNRADYPRLWETVQTFGSSLVSDAVWSTAVAVTSNGQTVLFPYKGCYSTGDGSTTFRLPDLRNSALRGVVSETGTDPDRVLNKPGGFQGNQVGEYTDVNGDSGGGTATGDTYDNGAYVFRQKTKNVNYETRMDNIGTLFVTKT